MTTKSLSDLERIDTICEMFADAFAEATTKEIDQAIVEGGLDLEALTASTTSAIDRALNRSLKKKLVEAGQAASREMAAHRPQSLENLTRKELVEKLKLITANEDNAGEVITLAARSNRGSMPIEELRSLIADFYSIAPPVSGDD